MDHEFENFTSNPPGIVGDLADVEMHFKCSLPRQYKDFMSQWDGGEGFVGDQYLILWRSTELVVFNDEYEVSKYAPGLLLFGSNGAGEAFAFDIRDNSTRIVMVPFVGLGLDDAVFVANTFEEFLSNVADGNLI